jgi:hypothetical protein
MWIEERIEEMKAGTLKLVAFSTYKQEWAFASFWGLSKTESFRGSYFSIVRIKSISS